MSVVSFGELLIDFVALESGVSVGDASGFKKAPGGAPANVAVAVARLGHDCAFLTQVGDDPFGHHLVEVLHAEGVDVSGVRFSTGARTMLAFVSLGPDGERSFSFYRNPSADMLMRPEDVAYDVIDSKQIFHFGSITLIDEPAKSATLAAVQHAREKDLFISYDPNLRLNLWPDAESAREGMLQGLNYANLLKVSAEEVEFLTGGTDPTPLWRDELKLIVVTHGPEGSAAYNRAGKLHVMGQGVKAVDTTGAGDAFVAGVLHGLLQHWSEREALFADVSQLGDILHFANSVGALATVEKGAISSLPSLDQARSFAQSAG